MQQLRTAVIATAVISTSIGFFLGSIITRKKFTSYYIDLVEKENYVSTESLKLDLRESNLVKKQRELEERELLIAIEETKLGLERDAIVNSTPSQIAPEATESEKNELLQKTGNYATPESAAKHLIPKASVPVMSDYGGMINYSEIAPKKKGRRNDGPSKEALRGILQSMTGISPSDAIINGSNKSVDKSGGENMEDRTKPYVIPKDEFFQNEDGYEQITVTFYEEDLALIDESDSSVTDIQSTVGDHVFNFGHLSGEPNVVYVRNDRLQIDFEVLRNEGSYSKQVLGLDLEESPGGDNE